VFTLLVCSDAEGAESHDGVDDLFLPNKEIINIKYQSHDGVDDLLLFRRVKES